MQAKSILLALSALLSFSSAQSSSNASTVAGAQNITITNATRPYTALTTGRPSLNTTIAAANSTAIAYSTMYSFNSSATVSYSNVTMTAPTLTSSMAILVATGHPTLNTLSSYYVIPASATLSQGTSGTKDAAATTSSGAASGRLSGSGAGILGILGVMGYLVV